MSPSRMNKSHYVFPRLLALAIAGTVTVAFAEGNVFWWKGPDWGSFNDPTNWDVGEAGAGNPSNLIPGAEDAVAHESDAKIDLGGNTYTIKRRAKDFTSSALASDYAIPYVLHLTNGTLVVTEHHTAKLNIEIWNGATYRFAGSTFTDAYSIWAEAEQKIHAGGRLEVGNSVNTLQLFGIKMTIDEGGVFYMDSKRLECIPTTLKVLTFTNNGTIEAPNGIYGSAPTWGSGADVSDKFPRFTQNAGGVIKLGGNVGRANNTYSKQLGFAVSGGKIEITNSVTFVNMSANPPTITDNASVEIEVKPDSLFDMSAMVFGEGANVMKSGTGDLKMGSVYPSVLAVNAGRLIAAEAASLVGISFAAGTQFRADVQHVRLDECSSFANATFSVAEDLFQIGSTVLISESPAILSHAKEGLDAQLQAAGVQAEGRIESGALVVRSAYPYTFYADRSTDLTDPTAWRSGSVPSAETPVRICGAGAANFTAESVKFASITVEEGATLSVSGGTSESPVDLPPIELDYAARLLLTEGSVVQMTNTFTCIGDASTLPVFEIATNATAIVQTPNFRFVYSAISAWSSFQGYDYGFSLKNVALRWYGTLQTYHGDTGARNEYSRLVLGWAEGGETSYIAIDCRGGRYVAAGEANHAGRCRTPLVIAAPVAPNSGTVVPVGTLYFRDYACVQRSSSAANPEYYVPGFFVGKWSQYNGTGNPVSGNPTSVEYDVVFEGTSTLFLNGHFRMDGGAHIILRGPDAKWSYMRKAWSDESFPRILHLRDLTTLTVEGGAYLDICSSDDGARGFLANGTQDGQKTFVMRNSRMSNLHWSGSGKNVAEVDDSLLEIGYLRSASTRGNITGVFNGFKSVEITNTFTIVAADVDRGNPSKSSVTSVENWDRRVHIAPPLTGTGSLAVSNELSGAHAVYSMTVTVTNGANTATGKAFAADAASGAPTALVFADGANWAGEVVADGKVSLTNLVDESAAASVSFGGIRLDADFPLRVWKTGGEIVSNDKVNLSSVPTGVCTFTFADMDEPLENGDRFEIGLYPESAVLPHDTKVMRYSVEPSETEGCVRLMVTYLKHGFVFVVK